MLTICGPPARRAHPGCQCPQGQLSKAPFFSDFTHIGEVSGSNSGWFGGKEGILPKPHKFSRANNTKKDSQCDAGDKRISPTQEPLRVKTHQSLIPS